MALKLVPDFVPAALIAARIQSNRGEARKAMSLLRRVWRATSHPHVATLYANAQSGVSAVDRLKRVRELIDSPPPNRPAAIVLARAAVDAYEWAAARNALASYSVADPTQAVCLLMAEIEEGQNADQGKAREWLTRAVRAPRRPGLDRRRHHLGRMGADLAGDRRARRLRVARAAQRHQRPRRTLPRAGERLPAPVPRSAGRPPRPKLRLRPRRVPSKRPPLRAKPAGAALAQLVEHIIRNDGVRCSSHLSGTTITPEFVGY